MLAAATLALHIMYCAGHTTRDRCRNHVLGEWSVILKARPEKKNATSGIRTREHFPGLTQSSPMKWPADPAQPL